eukprot:TRINITY_DN3233_c0_g4_i1.p1 TRINITY_DN3233_c0_g4~~TRINITY_DN3233_c0_g4_i1.p1  ORF type:complete len:181 (-),score=35.44 TRINITY_DN3233_c0_g4_i1:351-893(-)
MSFAKITHRATNKISSSFASSAGGRKLLKEFVDESVFDALGALKKFVSRVEGSETAGEELEKNVLRLATKFALLYKNKQIQDSDLNSMIIPMKVSASLVIKQNEEPDPNFEVEKLEKHLTVLRTELSKLVKAHLHDKSVARFESVSKYTTPEYSRKLLTQAEHKEELAVLANSLSRLLWG